MRVVSVSHEVKVSEWCDGKDLYHYKPQGIENSAIKTVSWGKSGTWLILVQEFNSPEIISLAQKAKFLYAIQNVKSTSCAAFQNTSSRKIALGTITGQLVMYDIKEKCIKRQFPSQNMPFFKIQFTVKDSHIVGGCKDGKVYIYKTNSGVQTAALSIPKSRTLTNFRCHPIKSNIIGMCSEDGTVAIWDFNVQKPTAYYEAHRALVSDMVIKHDTVLSIGIDRRLCFFDYRNNKLVSEYSFDQSATAFDLFMDGHSLCLGFTNGEVKGFDLRFMKQTTDVLSKHTSRINQLLFDNVSSKMPEPISEEPSTTDSIPNKSNGMESFSGIYCASAVANSIANINSQPSMNASDSFMDEVKHNLPTSNKSLAKLDSSGIKETIPYVMSPHPLTPISNYGSLCATNTQSQFINKRTSLEAVNSHSTPISSSAVPMPSPIYPTSSAPLLDEKEIKRIVKETIQEEIGELRKEMTYYMNEVLTSVKQNTLGVQWSLAKLSVNLDEGINQVRRDMFQPEESF